MNDENRKLSVDWVDFDLHQKIGRLVVRHMKAKGKENLVGVQIATQALTLVAAIVTLDPPQVRGPIILDVCRFIQELATKGWDRDEAEKRRRPN